MARHRAAGRGARPRRRRAPDRAARARHRAGARRPSPRGRSWWWRWAATAPSRRSPTAWPERPRPTWRWCSAARDATSSARSASPRMPTARWRWRRMRPPAPSTWAASATRAGTARPQSRHFVNVASAGMTGVVADRVNRGGKPLGATAAFAWAAVATFVGYRNSPFTVEIDDERIEQVCNNVIVANCRYFAGGMKILPDADPSDGLLDVLVWGDVSKARPGPQPAQALPRHARRPPQGHDPSRPPGGGDAALAAADRGRRRAAGPHPGHVRGGAVSSPASRSRLRRRGASAWPPRRWSASSARAASMRSSWSVSRGDVLAGCGQLADGGARGLLRVIARGRHDRLARHRRWRLVTRSIRSLLVVHVNPFHRRR